MAKPKLPMRVFWENVRIRIKAWGIKKRALARAVKVTVETLDSHLDGQRKSASSVLVARVAAAVGFGEQDLGRMMYSSVDVELLKELRQWASLQILRHSGRLEARRRKYESI